MGLSEAFKVWQQEVNADAGLVQLARDRRDMFVSALRGQDGIVGFIPSGSIARGSQIEPINDVDLIVTYDSNVHPEWGSDGASATEALDDLADRVRATLGGESASGETVRRVEAGNHAVKCWIDDPDDEDAFTVDVVPALEFDDHLIIPESKNRRWIETHPRFLLNEVANRQKEWSLFVPSIRVLKRWSRDNDAAMVPLVVEVLALEKLRQDDRPTALATFFTAAAAVIDAPVMDPSGVGGVIQPDLDVSAARAALERAADLAWGAIQAAENGAVTRSQCLWREVLGDDFPQPPGGCNKSSRSVAGASAAATTRRPVRDAAQG